MTELKSETFYESHADFCSLFANEKRLKIVDVLLMEGTCTVSELETLTGITQSTLSQHLKLMRDRGLLIRHKDGVNNHYEIADDRIVESVRNIQAIVRESIES